MSESDQLSGLESHSSILARTSLNVSPRPTSAPGLVAATSDEGSNPKAHSHEDQGILYLSPVDLASQANTVTIVNPPQLPPPRPVDDMVIEGSSPKEFDTKHTGDPPPHTSHDHHDVV